MFLLSISRSVWAAFLTDDPAAWMIRVGEHNMFVDQGTHVDVNPVKILFHPDRDGKLGFTRALYMLLS